METVKLYEADPFLKEFSATVLSSAAAKGGYEVILDRTAFYPEGGGQGADHGTLASAHVSDVHEREGVIVHLCDAPLPVGESVHGVIDWARRFDHMQQHSGEHILSGILCREFHCDNVGFHLGADTVTIDYNADISWQQALRAEQLANEIIWADAPVEVTFPTAEELSALDYRSKKALTGRVRIVTFPEADCCACCGTHVLRAGQVGLIKILSCQKFREGVRMEILCGQRALHYLAAVYEQDRTIAQRLSVKPTDTLGAVERLESDLSAAKAHAAALEEQVFSLLAAQYEGQGDVLLIRPSMKSDSVRKLADTVARRCGGLAAVFAGADSSYAYALVRADGADISPLVKSLNQALQGRGGGRSGFAQGSVQSDSAAISAYFSTILTH